MLARKYVYCTDKTNKKLAVVRPSKYTLQYIMNSGYRDWADNN